MDFENDKGIFFKIPPGYSLYNEDGSKREHPKPTGVSVTVWTCFICHNKWMLGAESTCECPTPHSSQESQRPT